MRYRQPVVIGRRLSLDFSNLNPPQSEQRRLDCHRGLQKAFFQHFLFALARHLLRCDMSYRGR